MGYADWLVLIQVSRSHLTAVDKPPSAPLVLRGALLSRMGKFRTGTVGYGFVACEEVKDFFGRSSERTDRRFFPAPWRVGRKYMHAAAEGQEPGNHEQPNLEP